MEPGGSPSPGLVGSIKRLTQSLLSLLQTRLELFAVELQEEKQRAVAVVVRVVVVCVAALLAVIMGSVAVVWFCPDAWRPYAIAAFALFYALIALGAGLSLRRLLHRGPPPFADSIDELKKDLACLKSQPPK